MEQKKCKNGCGKTKNIDQFSMKDSYTGARQSKCKECLKLVYAEYRRKKRLGVNTRPNQVKRKKGYEGEFVVKAMIPMTPQQAQSLIKNKG